MTPERKAKLDEIYSVFKGVPNYTQVTSPQLDDVQWLIAELKSAWEREAELVEWLELTRLHFKHPMHDHNWAFYLNEKHTEALDQHKASLEEF